MNYRPNKPRVTIELEGNKYTLHYDHKDFVNAQRALLDQGIEVAMIGPTSADFWLSLTKLVEGPRAERLLELIPLPSNQEDDEEKAAAKRQALLTEIDWWKVDVLLYVGLFRTVRGLSFDLSQDFITHDPAQQLYVATTVIPAALNAIRSYLPAEVLAKRKEESGEAPLAPVSGGEEESPSPAPSESPSENSGT